MVKSKATILKNLLDLHELLVVPGVSDCISARLVEKAGFKAVYVSGYSVSASFLGKYDMGVVMLNEQATIAGNIAQCVDIPVICDGDIGFGSGSEANVARTVKMYQQLGIAGMQLDDMEEECCPYIGQEFRTAPIEKVLKRINAARNATKNDFCLFVTCSVFGKDRRPEAISRIKEYMEAGADAVSIPPLNIDDMRFWGEEAQKQHFSKPIISVACPPDCTPTIQELEKWGYKFIWVPLGNLYSAAYSQKLFLEELKNSGITHNHKAMIEHKEFLNLLTTY